MNLQTPGSGNDLFVQLANAMPHLVWMAAPEGAVTFYNDRVADFSGAYKTADGNWHWESLMHPDDLEPTRITWEAAVAAGHTYEKEHRVCMKDGNYRWHLSRAIPQKDADGNVTVWYGTATDIHDIVTARERQAAIDHELAYQKTLLETVTENTDMALFLMDERQYCVYMNEAAEQLTGYTLDELKGKQLHYYIHHTYPDGRPYPLEDCPIDQALPAHKRMKGEEVFVHRDGHFYPVAFTASPIIISGQPVGTVIEVRGTAEEKERERALLESEALFRHFSDNLNNLAWIADANGHIFWYNQRWFDYTGTTMEEMQGPNRGHVHHPDHHDRVRGFVTAAWQQHEPWELTFPLRSRDGSYRWFLTRAVPVTDDEGQVYRWIGTNTDIHEQMEAEAALRQAKEDQEQTTAFLESLLQHAPVGFAFFDREHRYLRVNETLAEINDLPAADHVGKHVSEVVRDGAAPIIQILDVVAATGQPVLNLEVSLPHPDRPETTRHWVLGFYPVFGKEGVSVVGAVLWEITDRVTALEALKESESRFRSLAETLPQMVWVTDAAGKPEYYSAQWDAFFGGNSMAAWEAAVHPDDRTASEKRYAAVRAAGASFRAEVRLRNKDGEYRWHASVAEPVKDSNGRVVKWVGALTDIHDRKTLSERLERLVAERTEELQRSNEDLQQFAHVASHDLKEPVRKIRTFANILNADAALLSDRGRTSLQKIQQAANRISDMIEGVLSYATFNANQEGYEPIDLNAVIADVTTDLELVIREKEAVVETDTLPAIEGAPVLIHQLCYNLLNNSLKFARPGVPPVIRIGSELLGDRIRLTVADNGIGFEPAYAERIFRTFTRLHPKDRYEGTGLGLALCKRIVERHGGTIHAEGHPGQGATFIIDLPAGSVQA